MSAINGILASVLRRDEVDGLAENSGDANRAGDGFFVPHRYYDHYDYVKSEWIAVTALLFLWLATLVARQVATMVDRRMADQSEEREPLLAGSQGNSRRTQWAPRFDRGADALRHALLMLLAAIVFASIPLPYTCKVESPLRPGLPIPPAPRCMTCLSNGTTLASSIISWVFFALSCLWLVMEVVANDLTSAAIARTLVSLACFPLILSIFVIGFKEWAKIDARDVNCN